MTVRKGEWMAGEQVLYFEIDSFIPVRDGRFDWEEYGYLVSYGGEMGHHVRSRVYRRDISQGLILDTERFPEVEEVLESLMRELGPVAGMMVAQEIAFEEVWPSGSGSPRRRTGAACSAGRRRSSAGPAASAPRTCRGSSRRGISTSSSRSRRNSKTSR